MVGLRRCVICAFGLTLVLLGCSSSSTPPPAEVKAKPRMPEPVVTYSASNAQPGEKIEHGEMILAWMPQNSRYMHSTILTRSWRRAGCRGSSSRRR